MRPESFNRVAAGVSFLPTLGARCLIQVYRLGVRPLLGQRCRFWPSCSEYGLEAFERHGFLGGLRLTARRLSHCHPWHPGGVDPVPESLFEPTESAGQTVQAGRPLSGRMACHAVACSCEGSAGRRRSLFNRQYDH